LLWRDRECGHTFGLSMRVLTPRWPSYEGIEDAALERTPPQARHKIASNQEGVQPDAAERDPRMQNCSFQFDAVVTMLDTGTEAAAPLPARGYWSVQQV
jgi:hypothetical protein